MNNIPSLEPQVPTHKPRPVIDLLVSIIIPSVILMKLSGEQELGAATALIVALAFPISWGLYEFIKFKKLNFIALLGLISVLLTGGIGLLELDNKWLAIKEAAVPGLIGLGVIISTVTPYPLIKTLIYNPKIMQIERIEDKLNELGHSALFQARLLKSTYFLSGSFFFSAGMNYILATWIVVSPAGTSAFNEELGQLTLVSYPMIALPSTLMMLGVFYYLWRTINGLTGLSLSEVMNIDLDENDQE